MNYASVITLFSCIFITNGLTEDKNVRFTVDVTNMPVLWQVDAADALQTSYELEESTYDRLKMFSELFYSKHPINRWISLLNYEELYFTGDYFIKLKSDVDTVILFSGTTN